MKILSNGDSDGGDNSGIIIWSSCCYQQLHNCSSSVNIGRSVGDAISASNVSYTFMR